jgi:hypothetical protein
MEDAVAGPSILVESKSKDIPPKHPRPPIQSQSDPVDPEIHSRCRQKYYALTTRDRGWSIQMSQQKGGLQFMVALFDTPLTV